MIGVPASPAKPTTNVDWPTYVPICDSSATSQPASLIVLGSYLAGMVCGVGNCGHHQCNDDAARATKKQGEDDEPSRRINGEPTEKENRREVASDSDDIELPSKAGKKPSKDAPNEGTATD